MENENTTKLWKVVVEISHSRSDGNGECSIEIKTRYFDDFRSAEDFAQYGDIGFFAQVVSRHIYEYNISSVRELERKKHEIIREVKDIEWAWE